MSKMVRTVASAIAHVDGCDLEVAISEREPYEIKARAAIEAMLEPSEEMLSALGPPQSTARIAGRAVWATCVTAVLSPSREDEGK